MRQNEDGKTVRAMDILFPGIGEIVGGSQREERLELLEQRMHDMNIPTEEMSWYLDTRRFGTCPHAGFGLGFERLVLWSAGEFGMNSGFVKWVLKLVNSGPMPVLFR